MTQEELSRKVGKSKNAVSEWERGVSAPSVESLRELCSVLRVTPAFLMRIDNKPADGPSLDELALYVSQMKGRIGAIRQDTEKSMPSLIDGLAELEDEAERLRSSI